MRVSHDGAARGIGGLLEDYAFCAEGLLALHSVTGRARWYRLAEDLITAACSRFLTDGALRDTTGESGQVLNAQGGRAALDPFDNAAPSGAAAFAGVLLSYSALSGSSRHRALAGNILELLPPAGNPGTPRGRLAARDGAGRARRSGGGRRRRPGHRGRAALHRELLLSPSPGLLIAVQDAADAGPAAPLLRGRGPAPDGSPQVFLCRGMVCDRPVGSVRAVRERLASMVE